MKRILIPTDFSDCATNALKAAVGLAELFHAELFLLHSVEGMGPVYTDYMGANKEHEQQEIFQAEQNLTKWRQQIDGTLLEPAKLLLKTGTVKSAVLETVQENAIDLLVMGTMGSGQKGNRRWGSQTAAVIGSAPVPVIVIPEEFSWSVPGNMLLACNHFEDSVKILQTIMEFADAFMARLQVVVFSDNEVNDPIEIARRNVRVKEYEDRLHEIYGNRVGAASHITGTALVNALNDFVEAKEIDFLVMVTYQRSLLERLFHPSDSKKMTYHTRIPLLVIPAPQS